jgi:hypothetical protein
MNENEPTQMSARLKRLQKVGAPADFDARLDKRLRAIRPESRGLARLFRPLPIAFLAVGGALILTAYLLFFIHSSAPPAIPAVGEDTSPSIRHTDIQQLPGENGVENGILPVSGSNDTLSIDTISAKGGDTKRHGIP